MEQILPDLFTFTGLLVGRVYLITSGDGLTLIDAGIPPAGKKILQQLTDAGYAATDIKRILITHAHPDHVGAVPELIKASGAELIVPEKERATIEGKMPIPRAPTFLKPPETVLEGMTVSQTVQDGEVLQNVMGGLTAVSTPGHAPGHTSYWQAERGILFCGDMIFNMRKMSLPYSFLTVDQGKNIQSIGKIAELDINVVCFGHGKPITENGSEKIRAFAKSVKAI